MQKLLLRFRGNALLQPWQQIDWVLLALVVGLTLLGGMMIRSVELNQPEVTDWWQHWVTGGVGLALAMAIAKSRYEVLIDWKWAIYLTINISLIAVRFIGTTALGAQRWINVAGFHVQPSEFAKVGMIVTLAALLHARGAATVRDLLKVLAIAAVPWGLVFAEPNLGTSLVFGAITMGMLFWADANPGWLILLISPIVSAILNNAFYPGWLAWVLLMGIIGWRTLPWPYMGFLGAMLTNLGSGILAHALWDILQDYQKQRLISFLNPERDPQGSGYHLIQSRIAIGSGQLFGQGLNQGTQTQLQFIPEQHTDFIFSAIGEELGFIGCMLVFVAFWLICLRLALIAQRSKDNFGSLLAIGVLSMMVFQFVVNIGMNIGMAPVTGIPLPLLSYGRSALLSNFIALGLVESVANHRPKHKF